MKENTTISITTDLDTADKLLVLPIKKRYYPKGTPDWVAVFQTKIAVAVIGELSGTARGLLLLMQQATQYDNFIGLNQKTMAERLKCSEIAVKKAVKELIGHNVIISFRDKPLDSMNGDGRRNNYILNEEYCWKGYPENMAKRIAKRKKEGDPKQMKLFLTEGNK